MADSDIAAALADEVRAAAEAGRGLQIVGSGSKGFLGRSGAEIALAVGGHCGIVHYEPVELVLTARAGTPLAEIEAALAEHGQMLPFEPPHFGPDATLGGTLATNLSGPRRPFAGAARDFVLGTRVVNGRGEVLRFGGEVMKNVAGYDVSRLMAGSHGTLGVLLEASLKVLPRPQVEMTLRQEFAPAEAIRQLNLWAAQPLPLSAGAYDGEHVYVRLSGTETGVLAAHRRIGGEAVADGKAYWRRLREHEHAFFDHPGPLWRFSVAPTAAPIELPGHWLVDWAGAQRWYSGDAEPGAVRQAAARAGGHATLWRGEVDAPRYTPLAPALLALHRRVKAALDPFGIFNPGHPLYPQA
ncbi:glycolate oxidase subunit GlcE [Acidihalobacter aeolianus]|uniref:Glycolate oxidase subunit GlcE n=1 Tax=Acidihalobacter aeolianus TaxID=2792603 RepID=A0A1D8K460_9GAMM|nr:glycolate oxidase subunit GlcE [Acidihalobacter aeolianus]AOV15742.1 glycolate oxidase subunit GlcE [Acidihalobacter aeolianus]